MEIVGVARSRLFSHEGCRRLSFTRLRHATWLFLRISLVNALSILTWEKITPTLASRVFSTCSANKGAFSVATAIFKPGLRKIYSEGDDKNARTSARLTS